MRLTSLDVRSIRNLVSVQIEPANGINLFTGLNGAGKTSLLESISLLSTGKSFRTGSISTIINREATELSVVGHVANEASGITNIAGISRSKDQLIAKINGQGIKRLSELANCLPCLEITAKNHELIEAGPSQRRSYLDWIVFHVEHDFNDAARRYRQVLAQRNAALKQTTDFSLISSWDKDLVAAAEIIHSLRKKVISSFQSVFHDWSESMPLPRQLEFSYRSGWAVGKSMQQALDASRDTCLRFHTTSVGPHRADIKIRQNGQDVRYLNSRGQQKLLAIVMRLVQCEIYKSCHGHPPVILFDDMESELDSNSQQFVFDYLRQVGAQVFLTGINEMTVGKNRVDQVFHVEQGEVRKVL